MENTGVVNSIKGCVGSGVFCFHNDGTLCHHIVTGRRILNTISKDDIISIESCKLSRVSIYGKVI